MPQLPKPRTSNILELEADSELLIYDLRINKAYNLNETSKAVYRACGGNDLLEGEVVNHFAGLSRREVIRKVGLASMVVLPVIVGLVAPSAAHAASSACDGNQQFLDSGGAFCSTDFTQCAQGGRRACRSCTSTFATGDARCAIGQPNGNAVGGICTCS